MAHYVFPSLARFEGYCIDMIETIAKNVSFNYIIRLVADNNYGSEVNGSWNGMIGEVRRGVGGLFNLQPQSSNT